MYIYLLIILLIIILISCNCVFPLSAGDIDSGKKAVENLIVKYPVQSNTHTLVGVIIEPRIDNLIFTIKHYLQKLPSDAHIQVYHGINNKFLLEQEFAKEILMDKISLLNMGVDNLTIQGYSYLLTHPYFWKTIRSNNVLIFQTDSITCGNSTVKLSEFYDYDFVGSPPPIYISYLINILFLAKGVVLGTLNFFNGGLSFRKKNAMLLVLKYYDWDHLTPEDVWFCAYLSKIGAKMPTREQAQKFGFEADKINGIPWGLHKPRKELSVLKQICPEVKHIPTLESHTDYRNLYLL
jgi:hypothetical protein